MGVGLGDGTYITDGLGGLDMGERCVADVADPGGRNGIDVIDEVEEDGVVVGWTGT
jgi:hypothetical protein